MVFKMKFADCPHSGGIFYQHLKHIFNTRRNLPNGRRLRELVVELERYGFQIDDLIHDIIVWYWDTRKYRKWNGTHLDRFLYKMVIHRLLNIRTTVKREFDVLYAEHWKDRFGNETCRVIASDARRGRIGEILPKITEVDADFYSHGVADIERSYCRRELYHIIDRFFKENYPERAKEYIDL
jgi:DNA-directed RNA polymerase specialized sigma24 family protein